MKDSIISDSFEIVPVYGDRPQLMIRDWKCKIGSYEFTQYIYFKTEKELDEAIFRLRYEPSYKRQFYMDYINEYHERLLEEL